MQDQARTGNTATQNATHETECRFAFIATVNVNICLRLSARYHVDTRLRRRSCTISPVLAVES